MSEKPVEPDVCACHHRKSVHGAVADGRCDECNYCTVFIPRGTRCDNEICGHGTGNHTYAGNFGTCGGTYAMEPCRCKEFVVPHGYPISEYAVGAKRKAEPDPCGTCEHGLLNHVWDGCTRKVQAPGSRFELASCPCSGYTIRASA